MHLVITVKIGLGIDFTARDLQNECKINGHPWEKAMHLITLCDWIYILFD